MTVDELGTLKRAMQDAYDAWLTCVNAGDHIGALAAWDVFVDATAKHAARFRRYWARRQVAARR